MVDDLLTVKGLQELLQVDRTTIYRMLGDGRLTGIKVGGRWRFARREVELLLAGVQISNGRPATPEIRTLPLECLQSVQNVFAAATEISMLAVTPRGEPLTELSNSCRFCNLIRTSRSGQRACADSWRQLALPPDRHSRFTCCHAGLRYARATIEIDGTLVAVIAAGQFHVDKSDGDERTDRIRGLAEAYGLDVTALHEASQEITLLDDRKQKLIGEWLRDMARAFEQVGRERAELIGRLRRIAAMSMFEPAAYT